MLVLASRQNELSSHVSTDFVHRITGDAAGKFVEAGRLNQHARATRSSAIARRLPGECKICGLKFHEAEGAQRMNQKNQPEDQADDAEHHSFDEHFHDVEDAVEDECGDDDGNECGDHWSE